MKKGPVNIANALREGRDGIRFSDANFSGKNALFWRDSTSSQDVINYESYLDRGVYFWDRWPNIFPTNDIFHVHQDPTFVDSVQGGAGTCYIMAAMSALGEYPERIKDIFLT